MTAAGDRIPAIEIYRGCRVHVDQSPERIASVVRPALDRVIEIDDVHALLAICRDTGEPPECRLLAAAKIEAAHQLAAESREVRPLVDLALVRAIVAGLDSMRWRDPRYFCSLLDIEPPGPRRAVPRPEPLPPR